MAKESSQALRSTPEVLLVPLTVGHQEISQVCWILCPIIPGHGPLAEKPAIIVEVDELVEHVHASYGWDVTEEVAVWVGSKDLR